MQAAVALAIRMAEPASRREGRACWQREAILEGTLRACSHIEVVALEAATSKTPYTQVVAIGEAVEAQVRGIAMAFCADAPRVGEGTECFVAASAAEQRTQGEFDVVQLLATADPTDLALLQQVKQRGTAYARRLMALLEAADHAEAQQIALGMTSQRRLGVQRRAS